MAHPAHVHDWAERFAVLGAPGRLRLLLILHESGPTSVNDLAERSGLSPTAVSHALRLLRFADMVTAERDGRLVLYRIDGEPAVTMVARVAATDPGAARDPDR